jgi:hypothetical protein
MDHELAYVWGAFLDTLGERGLIPSGMTVRLGAYSPGDGVTRYRVELVNESNGGAYPIGGGTYWLGRKAAIDCLRAMRCGMFARENMDHAARLLA